MKILIADDHGIVRAGIRLLLERQSDLHVVAEAADGLEALECALAAQPDLCILDVGMPRMTGLQAAREIRSHLPSSRVLILSMHDDEHYLFEALEAGASGYVLKREADHDLVGAIRAVARDEPFLTNAAERSIIRRWMADGAPPKIPLTPREEEVVKLIAEAHTTPRSPRCSTCPRRRSSPIGPTCCASWACGTGSSWSATRSSEGWSSRNAGGPGVRRVGSALGA